MKDISLKELYINLVGDALKDLAIAVDHLRQDTFPFTPLPNFREFEIVDGLIWPEINKQIGKVYPYDMRGKYNSRFSCGFKDARERVELAQMIVKMAQGQPKKVLKAVRRIQAATAWCYSRAEGRKRMAEEILRQQAKAKELLEIEIALRIIGKTN